MSGFKLGGLGSGLLDAASRSQLLDSLASGRLVPLSGPELAAPAAVGPSADPTALVAELCHLGVRDASNYLRLLPSLIRAAQLGDDFPDTEKVCDYLRAMDVLSSQAR